MPFADFDAEPAAPWPVHLHTWESVRAVAVPAYSFERRQFTWTRAPSWPACEPTRGVLPPCLYDVLLRRIRYLQFETADGAIAAVAMIVWCPAWGGIVRGEK